MLLLSSTQLKTSPPTITFLWNGNPEACTASAPSSARSPGAQLGDARSAGQALGASCPRGAKQGARARQVLPQQAWGEGQRPSCSSSALGLSKYQTEKERKVVAAHRKKPLTSDEGLGQLSHCASLPRGRRSWPYLPALQPQAAPLPPSPGASAAETARPGLLSCLRTRGREGRGVGSQRRNENRPWQKALV